MMWLPDGEKNVKICIFASTESTNVTDRQTDRQTPHDGIGRTCTASHVNQEAQLSQRDRVRFVSLNILLSHSRSFEIIMLSRACVSPYQNSIETMYVVPFLRYSASKNGVTSKPVVGVVQGH